MIYDFSAKKTDGSLLKLADFRGKVLLIVNVASACGFTPQYEGLQRLYERYAERGLVILGFPCNQFGGQEPGSNDEIQNFCSMNYGVRFPILAKVDVNGTHADPIYKFLQAAAPGILGTKGIKWNFTKFLVSRDGRRVKRFAPKTAPEALIKAIEDLL